MQKENTQKTPRAIKEEGTLAFWKEHKIFEKTLEKDAPQGEFVFYEGPPTANAKPALHHLISRVFKDVIPRYKTMQGYFVRRKAGWDTHGLPVELQVEKALGFKSKKDIESYGIVAFNKHCKENVWKNIEDWVSFTERIGYWVDQKSAYITYKPEYMESLWWIMSQVEKRGLLYKDYRIVPWCPRCGTALSSHELAQGYADVKDPSVYVKFAVEGEPNTYFLVWTTTPWTLPSNLALAVNPKIKYVKIKILKGEYKGDTYILAESRWPDTFQNSKILPVVQGVEDNTFQHSRIDGSEFVGKKYIPLFNFFDKYKNENSFKVYAGNFVSTDEGTGIVHIAPMYGQDDFELGTKNNLPKIHLVDDAGKFLHEAGWLFGKVAKDNENKTNIEIIKYLHGENTLFKNGTMTHTYPFCWRCKTPLLYYARDSWYIQMSKLRDELVQENKKIHWEPEHLQEGRFGEWLREVKDWAISRERYWGTPLPVWVSSDGDRKVIGSIEELREKTKSSNTYTLMRHGIAENNTKNIISAKKENPHHLTAEGEKEVERAGRTIRHKKIDYIYASPFLRTKETAYIIQKTLGLSSQQIIFDERLSEINAGDFNLRHVNEYHTYFNSPQEKFIKRPPNGESAVEVKKRVGDFLYDIDAKHNGKNILVITHEYPIWLLECVCNGYTDEESIAIKTQNKDFIKTGEARVFSFARIPHNENYELDLHRPYIDEITFEENGKTYARVPEVMDVWFDSGAMPFAQDHYPFEKNSSFSPEKGLFKKQQGYPADYISEAIDQTRGWFYTLLAVGVLLGYGTPYKNVISLGHILDEKGKKMSKSIGNILDPWILLNKYGADTLRFWMFTINQPGESKNFDEKTVAEIQRKTIGLLENVVSFYVMYADGSTSKKLSPEDVLDRWIYALYNELVREVTKALDEYKVLEAGRLLRDFIGELSQWYLRRSRDRFRGEDEYDKKNASETLDFILLNLSKLMAPFMPFIAEEVYKELGGGTQDSREARKESVHLETWPTSSSFDSDVITLMKSTRVIVEEALALRNKANIKVRQPLAYVSLKDETLKGKNEFLTLIKDELNVKEVLFDINQSDTILLNTAISEDLRREGEVRDLMRSIQDLRKEKGLQHGEKVRLLVKAHKEMRGLIEKNKEIIMRTTSLADLSTEEGEYKITLVV